MFATLEDFGSTQKHCNMSIMPTCVHYTSNFAFMLPFHSFLSTHFMHTIMNFSFSGQTKMAKVDLGELD